MRQLAIVASMAMIGVATHGLAATVSGAYMTLGPGNSSCGSWTDNRKNDKIVADASSFWVLGYVTAYNHYVAPNGDVSIGTDVDGMEAWIDNYCQAHPIDDVNKATMALISALKAKSR